jgi:A/G-specific adenine glycosylase
MRALRLQRAAREIARRGGFPRSAAELEGIEGIGPFTAAVVASFSFGEPVPAVDTNVERIVRRLLGDVEALRPRRAVRETAGTLISRRAPGRWNQALMDLGALVCTARAPRCAACPLARWCRGRRRVSRGAAPKPARRERKEPFSGSRRYYRGRIVQALRQRASLTLAGLLARLDGGLDRPGLADLLTDLRRDGLVRVTRTGRVRLP